MNYKSTGVKVYNLSHGKTLPQWLSEKRKKSLRYDQDFRKRIELVQDLDFPVSSQRVKISDDGNYILSTGVYPPQIRVHDTFQLSMKFERHIDCEVVDFHVLSQDYSKIVFLEMDRTIEFHVQYGTFYKTRIPTFGRSLCYIDSTCDLYIASGSPQVYRLNLDQGKFISSLNTQSSSNNVVAASKVHELVGVGGENGNVEFWDARRSKSTTPCASLKNIHFYLPERSPSAITAITFDEDDSLRVGVGVESGQCLLYDLRSSKPLFVKDHQYDIPIHSIRFHNNEHHKYVISSDSKIIKIWDSEDSQGKTFVNIEADVGEYNKTTHNFSKGDGSGAFNEVCVVGNSGLLFAASESKRVQTYFIPELGPAPKWASFLDNLAEELDESSSSSSSSTQAIFDNYKFVTKNEFSKLGISGMEKSEFVRPYMHGYFMDIRFYNKLVSVADPFAFEEYRKQRIKEKIEERRSNKISIRKTSNTPKVNANLAKSLDKKSDNNSKSTSSKKKNVPNLRQDERFASLFLDPDFQIDQGNSGYKLMTPIEPQGDEDNNSDFEEISESEDENSIEEDNDNDNDDKEEKEKTKKIRMYQMKKGRDDPTQILKTKQNDKYRSQSLESRIKKQHKNGPKSKFNNKNNKNNNNNRQHFKGKQKK